MKKRLIHLSYEIMLYLELITFANITAQTIACSTLHFKYAEGEIEITAWLREEKCKLIAVQVGSVTLVSLTCMEKL